LNGRGQTATVSHAQALFDDACSALAAAVKSLVEVEGETVMANAHLVALLVRVAAARDELGNVGQPPTAPWLRAAEPTAEQ